jgi:F0F1-type ATP synthase membrane subunit b/b'
MNNTGGKALKKIWTYIKNYWYVPVIVVAGIAVYFVTKNKDNMFFQMFKKALEQNKKDIEKIENNNVNAEAERQKAQQDAEAYLEKVKEGYRKKMAELEDEKKQRAEELLENSDDPEKLAKELSKVTGWKYVPPED